MNISRTVERSLAALWALFVAWWLLDAVLELRKNTDYYWVFVQTVIALTFVGIACVCLWTSARGRLLLLAIIALSVLAGQVIFLSNSQGFDFVDRLAGWLISALSIASLAYVLFENVMRRKRGCTTKG